MSLNMEIIIGTYNEFLLGYRVEGEIGDMSITQTFSDKSHVGPIKSLAQNGLLVATGGHDDRIFIYDMQTRKRSQVLNHHEGTVNSLEFTSDQTHLFSGGEDGRLLATNVRSWKVDGAWPKAHNKCPVRKIICHPSNRLALSLGDDDVLNTWNLVRGRNAYRTNLKSRRLGRAPDCLSWSKEGTYFSISDPLHLEIWDIASASTIRRITLPAKPICCTWVSDEDCLTGLEDGRLAWITVDKNSEAKFFQVEDHRVKAIAYFPEVLVTIGSTGSIKVWSCDVEGKHLELCASKFINCRPTCLAVLDLALINDKKGDADNAAESPIEKQHPVAQDRNSAKSSGKSTNGNYVAIEHDEDEDEEKDDSEDEAPNRVEASSDTDDGVTQDHNNSESETDAESETDFESNSDSDEKQAKRRPPANPRKRQNKSANRPVSHDNRAKEPKNKKKK